METGKTKLVFRNIHQGGKTKEKWEVVAIKGGSRSYSSREMVVVYMQALGLG